MRSHADELGVLATPITGTQPEAIRETQTLRGADYLRLSLWIIALATLIAIPLGILSYGYMPYDDALRHAAKGVSGKAWSEVLLLADWVTMDHNPGWHAILRGVHRLTGWGAEGLVVFSVGVLLLWFYVAPLIWLRRPEVWLATLLLMSVSAPDLVDRLAYGRPFIFSTGVVMVLLLIWGAKDAKLEWRRIAATIAMFAAATWIHGAWYLFVLPAAAFACARKWQISFCLGGAWLGGSFLGALLTGRPFAFLAQAIEIVIHCFTLGVPAQKLAAEFQPSDGAPYVCLAAGLLALARVCTGARWRDVADNAPFYLMSLAYLLGLRVGRFWFDWGLPAFLVWTALQLDALTAHPRAMNPLLRLSSAVTAAVLLLCSVLPDRGVRWSAGTQRDYIKPTSHPGWAEWMPGPGGIVYNTQMTTFYRLLYANPEADWKYVLGFEPALMTPENLAVYRQIATRPLTAEILQPWVRQMRPQDRIVIDQQKPPEIPGLEWKVLGNQMWFGRLARTGATSPFPFPSGSTWAAVAPMK